MINLARKVHAFIKQERSSPRSQMFPMNLILHHPNPTNTVLFHVDIFVSFRTRFPYIFQHLEPLLGNDSEISKYATAIAL
jgi:hypothetical protein